MFRCPIVALALTAWIVPCAPAIADGGRVPEAATESPDSKDEQAALATLREEIAELRRRLAEVSEQLARLQETGRREARETERERLREAARRAARPSDAPETISPGATSRTRNLSALNPELSITGDMFYRASDSTRDAFSAGHWELDLRSDLDPYSKLHFVLGVPEGESPELEEGYVTWHHLPGGLSLSAGKRRAQFGTLNRFHAHALDQSTYPWALDTAFGEEGLTGTGLFLHWLIPRPWASANEVSLEVFNADNESAFAGAEWERPAWLLRLKNYWDLGADTYLEVGLNHLAGRSSPGLPLQHTFDALDMTWNWYPAHRGRYREVLVRGLLMRSRREQDAAPAIDSWSGYLYGQVRLSARWITGLRYDRLDGPRASARRGWGWTPYLSWWQSEFVRLRAEWAYQDAGPAGVHREFRLQLTIAAGPHKHENY
ncbi:MAG: hypothetical protein Q9Q40_12410 [Acidobacteriota bacterium]|nr:hypothetical protein [Acidobacteriota bacterium]MDQ7088680.1 hypothetical protein [Acidobacteriota bacterium]